MDVKWSSSGTSVMGPQVRRLKTLKRGREGKESTKEITLQTVLGVTASTNTGLASSPSSGI